MARVKKNTTLKEEILSRLAEVAKEKLTHENYIIEEALEDYFKKYDREKAKK